MRVHTRDPAHPRLCICICICIYVYVRAYVHRCTCRVRIRDVYAPKTSPLTPFVVVYRCSLFSRCRFLFFFFPSFFLSASRSPRRATIHLSSSFIYDRKSRDRVGNNVPREEASERGKFSRARFFSFSLTLVYTSRYSLLFSHVENSTVLLCMSLQRKGLGRGKLSCRIQRGDRRDIPETRRGMAERKSDREGEREMIIHSAVITQSPAP